MNTPKKPGGGRKKMATATQKAAQERAYQLPARVGPRLRKALEECADGERRHLSPMVVILLEEALKQRGLWPPKDA